MSKSDKLVLISSDFWKKYGFRTMRWIDETISDDCYRLLFGTVGYNTVGILFNDGSQATMFKMVIGCDIESASKYLENY